MDIFELTKALNDASHEFYVEREDFDLIPVKGYKNGLKYSGGIYLPLMFRNSQELKNMSLREDDTFVITFPKSGIFNTNQQAETIIYCEQTFVLLLLTIKELIGLANCVG